MRAGLHRAPWPLHFHAFYHLYIGQEATAAAAVELLRPDDRPVTTHRNHGHILARRVDPGAAFAEILGRATGLNGRKLTNDLVNRASRGDLAGDVPTPFSRPLEDYITPTPEKIMDAVRRVMSSRGDQPLTL